MTSIFKPIHEKILSKIDLTTTQERNLVKLEYTLDDYKNASNPHKVVQILLATFLFSKGYQTVKVEYPLKRIMPFSKVGNLRIDLFGKKEKPHHLNQMIFLEVETGHVPSSHHTDQATYRRVRDSAKVARYFRPYPLESNERALREFGIAVPHYYVAQLSYLYVIPPEKRTEKEVMKEKEILDSYYDSPHIKEESLKNARIDYIFEVIPDYFLQESKNGSWIHKYLSKTYLQTHNQSIMKAGSLSSSLHAKNKKMKKKEQRSEALSLKKSCS